MSHTDIDSLIERADKMLDGMTINRELFAKDVKRAAAELKRWREAHARSSPKEAVKDSPFAGTFGDIMGDIFRKK